MDSENRASLQNLNEKKEQEETKKDTNNNVVVNDAIKQKYRNVTATLAASAWGDDNGHRQNSPGSFRNMGKLGRADSISTGSVLSHIDVSTSAFQLVQRATNQISNSDPEKNTHDYESNLSHDAVIEVRTLARK